ncbi:unnamed protein product, partial [Effrenium voratum]
MRALWLLLALAAAEPVLEADDECQAEGCALNALQVRKRKVDEEQGCHDVVPGEGGPCWRAIMWAKNVGMPRHPQWYAGMTEDSPLWKFQFMAWNTTHPSCPRPCNVPSPGAWCKNAVAPRLWKPAAAGAPIQIKALSYNLFWWHLFKVEGGRGDSAGHLIQQNSEPHFDVMGFQECEDPVRVLGPVGLLEHYEAFQATHAICMAYRKDTWSLIQKGETDVAEDMRTEYYGTRGTQWMRLQHKVFTAARPMAAAEGFEEFLVGQHKVAPEVLQQLRAEGVESLSDFVGLFTEADYEQALKDEVLSKVESHRDSKIQLARLRVAWMRARQEVQNVAPASSLPDSSADLEAPLPAEVRQRQEDAFHSRYNLRFPPELTPAPTLFARHFREFRRQKKELDDLSRVRSAAEISSVAPTEVKQLGDFRVVLRAPQEPVTFKDLVSLLRAHELLLNSWALAGTAERGSKLKPGQKTVEFDMTANLAYRSFAIERVRKFRGTLGQTISWFLDRDRETQKVALSLYAEGYPWGEAMQQTYENRTAVLWQIGPVGVVDDSLSAPPALPDKPAAKKRKDDTLPDTQKRPRPDRSTGQQVDTSTGKSIQLKDLCPDWNRGQCT